MNVRSAGLWLLVLSACSLDRTGLGRSETDAGRADAGGIDATVVRVDAGPPRVDAGPFRAPDAGFDAGVDAGERGVDAGPPMGRDCSDRYDDNPSFGICTEDANQCRFGIAYFTWHSCRRICEDGGGRCDGAWVPADTDPCHGTPTSCDDADFVRVCLCSY
ncbi:MAG: hypothetical protein AB7S26_13630 [Sandaracinaceae bacterium]